MAKFMYLYHGPATDTSKFTQEQMMAEMERWNQWGQKLGSALVDFGTPIGPGKAIVDNGSSLDPLSITGYSIVEAANLAEAVKFADSHPFLSSKTGEYSLHVLEMQPIPGA